MPDRPLLISRSLVRTQQGSPRSPPEIPRSWDGPDSAAQGAEFRHFCGALPRDPQDRDVLAPQFGDQAIRYSMLLIAVSPVLTALCFWRAALLYPQFAKEDRHGVAAPDGAA